MNGVGDYMRFVSGHHGSLDRVGGIPTHLPPEDLGGNLAQMYFVGQFYCSESRLNLPGTLCLQIYQEAPDDDLLEPDVDRSGLGDEPTEPTEI